MRKQPIEQISDKFKALADLPKWMREDILLHIQVKFIRLALGMTQAQLAGRAGTSQADLAKLERGRRQDVRLSTLKKIASALNSELLIQLVPKKNLSAFVEEKSLELARKLISQSSSNMAMELQKPGKRAIQAAIEDLKNNIMTKHRSKLWEENGA